MHDGMPYGRNQRQGQGHSREVDRQSPTGLLFIISIVLVTYVISSSK